MSSNPFLTTWKTPFNALPFNEIKDEHFLPAIETGVEEAHKNYSRIRGNAETPTFENTVLALEQSTEILDRVAECYFNLFSAEADEKRQALAKEISPKLAALSSDLLLDEKIFARVKTLWEKKDNLKLGQEEYRVLEKTYKAFKRNGALLSSHEKEKLRKIDQESSTLGPKFSENLLKATNSFILHLTKESDLSGLPESYVAACKEEATNRNLEGWVVTLQFPSYVPFMMFSDRRSLRQELYEAFAARTCQGELDNKATLKRIADLRQERAEVLGYKSHADYVLEERMAENPTKVHSFLDAMFKVVKPAAQKDLSDLKALRKELEGDADINHWDVLYYSEKLKAKLFNFNEEDLRPYFKLENVIEGVFEHAKKLYDIEFKSRSDIPTYHPDVKVFEVLDANTHQHVGLFYADFFPRTTKKDGAWMTNFREQGLWAGKIERPQVAIVCNFTKPLHDRPSLLSFEEVRTLFHEFGHALHGLLSNCRYRSVAGTNVFWDFVELPSQIMENWCYEKESLDLFAKHFETGAKIPTDLVEKLKKSATFQAGYMALRQITFAKLDMAWHDSDPRKFMDVDAFEDKILDPYRPIPRWPGTSSSCSFAHIFAGGYSSGYYSYKWAEVLDADAFEYFQEKGVFSKEVARAFKENILTKGGSDHPMNLYKKFRGREPDPNALLRREGLLN